MNIIGKYAHSLLTIERMSVDRALSITRVEYERDIEITEVQYPGSENRRHRKALNQFPQTQADIEALEAVFGPVKIIKLEPL